VGRKKEDKPSAYAWVAYMFTHQPEEIARVRKYGTPSDKFIKIAEQPVAMTTSEGKFKLISFPKSLNSRAGQNLLHETVIKVDLYLRTIPIQAFDLLNEIKATLRVRRADTLSNVLIVAEALLHRAASEFKHEVLFAFDSINVWVKSVYGKELGYLTIRKALEILVEKGFIKVNEWGKRGNRSKCTKIEFLPLRNYVLTYTSNLDDWLLLNDHAMVAVYRRESTTRQDVLESRFQHYADELAAEMVMESRWAQGARLFPVASGKMVVLEPKSVSLQHEKELFNETYIDRLLGGLVSAVQEDGPDPRARSSGLLGAT
jgi:hypothetical protein